MKQIKYAFTILLLVIFTFSFSACNEDVYVHQLDKREDGRYYKAGEDKPFSGIAKSKASNGEWEYDLGIEIRHTSYYSTGNIRFESRYREGLQYYSPDGSPISKEEYGKKYTPIQGYE
ncbi:MAG: hypothetical protein ACLVKO_01370 [Dysgonomonas sp.]